MWKWKLRIRWQFSKPKFDQWWQPWRKGFLHHRKRHRYRRVLRHVHRWATLETSHLQGRGPKSHPFRQHGQQWSRPICNSWKSAWVRWWPNRIISLKQWWIRPCSTWWTCRVPQRANRCWPQRCSVWIQTSPTKQWADRWDQVECRSEDQAWSATGDHSSMGKAPLTATGSVFGSQAAVWDHDGGVGERNAKLHERNLCHGVWSRAFCDWNLYRYGAHCQGCTAQRFESQWQFDLWHWMGLQRFSSQRSCEATCADTEAVCGDVDFFLQCLVCSAKFDQLPNGWNCDGVRRCFAQRTQRWFQLRGSNHKGIFSRMLFRIAGWWWSDRWSWRSPQYHWCEISPNYRCMQKHLWSRNIGSRRSTRRWTIVSRLSSNSPRTQHAWSRCWCCNQCCDMYVGCRCKRMCMIRAIQTPLAMAARNPLHSL